MKTFTKISTATLFALFLAGCDQASSPSTQNNNAQQTTVNAETTQGAEDFKVLLGWKVEQEKHFSAIYDELKQQIATNDKTKIAQSLTVFQEKTQQMVKELDNLTIKNAEVSALKIKAKENLELLNNLIVASVNGMISPSEELQKVIQEQMQTLSQSTSELNQLQTELTQKFLKQ